MSSAWCNGSIRRFARRLGLTLGGIVLAASFSVSAADSFDSVYISELLIEANRGASSGRDPGWIELFNGGSAPVSLAGWFLSDTSTDLTKWRFPRVVILPGSYLVVSASGTGLTNDLSKLQANFLLNKDGGQVLLSGRATNLTSEFNYPRSVPGVSIGCVRGEPSLRGNFAEPTPGKANQSAGVGFSPKVTFSRPSGSFLTNFSLTLSAAFSGDAAKGVIRYTLDGRMPNSTSPIYREPIVITNTASVRARAYQEGLLPGPPQSGNYLALTPQVQKFSSSLPVIVMNTVGGDAASSGRCSYLSFFEPEDGKTSLGGRCTLVTRGDFRVRGSSSAGMPQPSFAVTLQDEFAQDANRSVLGLPADSDWVLYAPNVFDPVLIHNPFIHQLSRDMGHYSPRTRFVEVFITLHAGPVGVRDYAGLYVLEEKIKIGKQRVAIDRLGPSDVQEPQVTGGYLVKFDRTGPGEQGFWAGGAEMVYVDPRESVIELPQRAPQRRYLSSYFDAFERMLRSPDWKDPVKGYRSYIEVDSWIDFHVLEVLSGNVDIFRFSTYFYKPRGGKLTFGPHWDFDRALGSIDHRDADPRRWQTGRFFDSPWWTQLFTDPAFWQLWVDRWQDLRRTTFSETHLFGLIDRLTGEVREAQPREAARWDLEPRGGSYQSEIDWMKHWLSERIAFIDRQLVQPPNLSDPAGTAEDTPRLTLTPATPGDVIYYTLDGSDPRMAQGDISSNAVRYTAPVSIEGQARVMARARNTDRRQTGGPPISTPWSSPVSAVFEQK